MTAMADWKHRGTMYVVDNATAETTVDTTKRKVIAPTFLKSGEKGLLVDTANNEIVIGAGAGGDYLVLLTGAILGATGRLYELQVYVDSTGQYISCHINATSADHEPISESGILTLAAGEAISVYQDADASTTLTLHDLQLTLVRLS